MARAVKDFAVTNLFCESLELSSSSRSKKLILGSFIPGHNLFTIRGFLLLMITIRARRHHRLDHSSSCGFYSSQHCHHCAVAKEEIYRAPIVTSLVATSRLTRWENSAHKYY